jgi:formylglycine-generating enzyme required for sulfatase activity
MSEIQPSNTDAILGGQTPPPVNAAVLGGVAGAKQKLAHQLGININDELFGVFLNELNISDKLAYDLIRNHDIQSFEIVSVDDRAEISTPTKKRAFYYTRNLGNGIALDMVHIPAGSFMMGASEGEEEEGLYDLEKPQHLVTLSAFHISKFPITQVQYQAVMMGENPSDAIGNNLPVHRVSWEKAKEFCQNLSQKFGEIYSLPSESQWEYACRAGTTTPFYFGNNINADVANYDGVCSYGHKQRGRYLYRKKPTGVGRFPPNAFGLYDLHGNIREWCEDICDRNYHGAPTDGKPWISEKDQFHVLRGGFWGNSPRHCRSAARFLRHNSIGMYYGGFRVMCLQYPGVVDLA